MVIFLMDVSTQLKIDLFVRKATESGWEWYGVQEALPGAYPRLIIQRGTIIKRIEFDPNDFDPIKTAAFHLTPRRKQ